MTLSLTDLQRLAGTAGFRAETLEKVLLLLDLLDAIRAHPFAGPRVVLKGGTALNLFALEIPRLSVDIDLNFIGAVDRATMEKERPPVDRDLQAACELTGVTVKRIPTEHAGGKWRLSFVTAAEGRNRNARARRELHPPRAALDCGCEDTVRACRRSAARGVPDS